MKTGRFLTSGVITVMFLVLLNGLVFAQAPEATPLGSGFTYQGELKSGGIAYSGTCDFQFELYDAVTTGSLIGELTVTDVSVTEGIFTKQLDFGTDKFTGDNRWLEIWVRCPAGSGTYQQLLPRQPLTAAPYALYTPDAGYATNALYADTAGVVPWSGITSMPAGFSDGVDNDTTYAAGTGLTLTGTTFSVNTTLIQSRVTGACISGYAIRMINPDGNVVCEPVGGMGWSLTGNAGTTPGTNYLGTSDNQALEVKVNDQRVFRFEPNVTSPNLVGGYSGNWLSLDIYGATISGGGGAALENRVTDLYGTVGGGSSNQAGDKAGTTMDAAYTTVSGGYSNEASGQYSVVGGGIENKVSGSYSTVSGGYNNIASADNSTISGGYSNAASGNSSTVSGGEANAASGYTSTVGGGYQNATSGVDSTISGGSNNTASGISSTVSGGYHNAASGMDSTVSGGSSNTASGYASTVNGGQLNTASNELSTVSGGHDNTASGISSTVSGGYYNIASAAFTTISGGGPSNPTSPTTTNNLATDQFCTIGGGGGNQAGDSAGTTADATYATVSGGLNNTASGYSAAIPGGSENLASGDYSFAAGYRAWAHDKGSFVWADSQDTAFASLYENTFNIRAGNGVFVNANSTNFPGEYVENIATGTSAGQGTAILGYSESNYGYGVAGWNYFAGVGVGAWSWDGNLIEAYSGDFPDAGTLRFYVDNAGNVHYDGSMVPYAEIPSPTGEKFSHVSLYGLAAAEAWYEDLGSASLVNGLVKVAIDPVFAQTVSLTDEYQVQVTATCGEAVLLFVSQKTATSFTVQGIGLDGKPSSCRFDYRISAKVLGSEDLRLEAIDIPDPVSVERELP